MRSSSGASNVSINASGLRLLPKIHLEPIRRATIATTINEKIFESSSISAVGSVPVGYLRQRVNHRACEDHSDEKSNGGYDSDGAICPFFDAIASEMCQCDEALMYY